MLQFLDSVDEEFLSPSENQFEKNKRKERPKNKATIFGQLSSFEIKKMLSANVSNSAEKPYDINLYNNYIIYHFNVRRKVSIIQCNK